jgi:hypothetical protein
MRRSGTAVALPGLVLLVLTLWFPTAGAQGVFGTITGTITDSSGGVLPGASVTVTNVATNVAKTLTTNGAGVYSATSLIPGSYKVEASLAGFKTAVVEAIALEVNANPKVDLTLEVGQATELVKVHAEAPLLQAEQTDLGQTVTQQQIEQLPTGRNLFSLIPLAAGVSQQVACDGSCGNNGNLRINGDRPRTQDYVLDGTTINAPVFGGQAINPSVDSIQEFRIEANSMSAEYGKAGGGLVIAVTKSGTNEFHGSGYEYHRNEALNARNFFEDLSKPKDPFEQNEFGGTIGGPVVKNRLFFFADYQGLRANGSSPVVGVTVPDEAFRNGDLSALCGAGFDAAGNCGDPSQQVRYPGTTTPVPFNRIATAQINTRHLCGRQHTPGQRQLIYIERAIPSRSIVTETSGPCAWNTARSWRKAGTKAFLPLRRCATARAARYPTDRRGVIVSTSRKPTLRNMPWTAGMFGPHQFVGSSLSSASG